MLRRSCEICDVVGQGCPLFWSEFMLLVMSSLSLELVQRTIGKQKPMFIV
jgi:hypothetical protein